MLAQYPSQYVHGVRVLAAVPEHMVAVVFLDTAKATKESLVGLDKLWRPVPLSCGGHGLCLSLCARLK